MANQVTFTTSRRNALIFCIYVLIHGNIFSDGYSLNDTDTLYNNLMQGYNTYARGKLDQEDIVYISTDFNLVSINNFDELDGRFSIVAYFNLYWTDDRMIWDPAQYNGTQIAVFPQKTVWKPLLVLGNPNDNNKPVGIDFEEDLIRYDPNGQAVWSPGDLLHVTCFPDVKYYPFDTQSCTLLFFSWGYTSSFVQFNLLNNSVMLTNYAQNGIWEITGSIVTAHSLPEEYPFLYITIHLKRRSFFYLINMILPIAAMGLINIFVFLLPPESGERVGYSITVLLAIAVFQTIASDHLPKSSFPSVSILSFKLLADFSISCLVMILSIISLRIYNADSSHPVPNWLGKITRYLLCSSCNHEQSKDFEYKDKNNDEVYNECSGTGLRSFETVKHKVNDQQAVTWTHVGRLMDWIFAIFSLLAFISSSVFFGVYITAHT